MRLPAKKLFETFLLLTVFLIPLANQMDFFDQLIDGQVWEYGRLSLYASMITLLLAGFFWRLAGNKVFSFAAKDQISKALIILFAYLLIIASLSPLLSISFYYCVLMLLAFLFIYLLKQIKVKNIIITLSISGLVQGAIAFCQFWQQQISANKWLGLAEHLPAVAGASVIELADTRLLRAYGALPHPNVLGGFLGLTILTAIWYWIFIYQQASKDNWQEGKKYLWPIVITLISLVAMTYGLIVSFSRSALLALGMVLAVSLAIALGQKNKLKIIVLAKYIFIFLLVGGVFYATMSEAWNARLQTASRLESKSISERIVSLQQIDFSNSKELIIGQGLGLNTYINHQTGTAPYTVQPIHNYFLLILAEVGLVGLILLFYLFYVYYQKTKFGFSHVWILLWLVVGLFDHYWWTSWTGWLMLAIILALSSPQKSHKEVK